MATRSGTVECGKLATMVVGRKKSQSSWQLKREILILGSQIKWDQLIYEKQLIDNIHDIVKTRKGLGGFDDTFRRCGYVE
mmetsp:Transcript_21310/g.46252  ORF Transcript_21310/g.46252 Transcript_21310/m.46252 type:complete len:80 (+) Transcript_21310:940-1179(+)